MPLTQKAAAELVNVSVRSVKDAVKLDNEGSAELKQQVTNGTVSVSAAADSIRSIFCPRCQRVGPRRDCKGCADLRKDTPFKPKSTRSKPKKIGSEKFDWKGFDTHYGFVARGIDEIRKAYGGDEHVECLALLTQFRKVFESWKKQATGMKELKAYTQA